MSGFADEAPCEHEICRCRVPEAGGFCSEGCSKQASANTGEMCGCGHPACALAD